MGKDLRLEVFSFRTFEYIFSLPSLLQDVYLNICWYSYGGFPVREKVLSLTSFKILSLSLTFDNWDYCVSVWISFIFSRLRVFMLLAFPCPLPSPDLGNFLLLLLCLLLPSSSLFSSRIPILNILVHLIMLCESLKLSFLFSLFLLPSEYFLMTYLQVGWSFSLI